MRISKEDLYCPHCSNKDTQIVNPKLLLILRNMSKYAPEGIKILSGYLCPQEAKRQGIKDTDSVVSGNVVTLSYNSPQHLLQLIYGALQEKDVRQIWVYSGGNTIRIGVDECKPRGMYVQE